MNELSRLALLGLVSSYDDPGRPRREYPPRKPTKREKAYRRKRKAKRKAAKAARRRNR